MVRVRLQEHPLASHLVVPPGGILLCAPDRGAVFVAGTVPEPHLDEYPLPTRAVAAQEPAPLPQIEVRFRLVRSDDARNESLWVLGPAEREPFRRFCCSADERLLRRFQVATVQTGGQSRALVRRTSDEDRAAILPIPVRGFHPDARLPGLFVPTGFALRPLIRTHELARALALGADQLVWLEPAGRGVSVQSVPAAAFRALHERVEYTVPAPVTLVPLVAPERAVPLRAPSQFRSKRRSTSTRSRSRNRNRMRTRPRRDRAPVRITDRVGSRNGALECWVGCAGGARRGRRKRLRSRPRRGTVTRRARGAWSASSPRPMRQASTGTTGRARRHELESRLISDFPRLGADERAARWAELARACTGPPARALDAAVCWTNALWECPVPPEPWLEQWAVAAARAASCTDRGRGPGPLVERTGRARASGRVIAALAAYFGSQPEPPLAFVAALPACWPFWTSSSTTYRRAGVASAYSASPSRSCDGDVLGLKRGGTTGSSAG